MASKPSIGSPSSSTRVDPAGIDRGQHAEAGPQRFDQRVRDVRRVAPAEVLRAKIGEDPARKGRSVGRLLIRHRQMVPATDARSTAARISPGSPPATPGASARPTRPSRPGSAGPAASRGRPRRGWSARRGPAGRRPDAARPCTGSLVRRPPRPRRRPRGSRTRRRCRGCRRAAHPSAGRRARSPRWPEGGRRRGRRRGCSRGCRCRPGSGSRRRRWSARCRPAAASRTFGMRWVSGSWSSPRVSVAPATLK